MPRPDNIFQQAIGEIRSQIRNSFAPGEALPSQRALSEMHGIGQATVHRILHQLAREGLVRPRPRRGWTRVGHAEARAPQKRPPPRSRKAGRTRVGLITRRGEPELNRVGTGVLYGALQEEATRRGDELVFVTNRRIHHPTPARNRIELARVPWNRFEVALLVEVEDSVTLSDPLLRRRAVLAVDQDATLFGLDSVSFDDVGAGRQVARHLFELGHRRFAVTDEVNDPGWPAPSS